MNNYSDKMLNNSVEMQKNLFLAKVEDPKKTMHYTGIKINIKKDINLWKCIHTSYIQSTAVS